MTANGCSSPLGKWIESQWPVALEVCNAHDEDYTRGGHERERLIADVRFYLGLLSRPIPLGICEQMYLAVRIFGGSHFTYLDGPDPDAPVTGTVTEAD